MKLKSIMVLTLMLAAFLLLLLHVLLAILVTVLVLAAAELDPAKTATVQTARKC